MKKLENLNNTNTLNVLKSKWINYIYPLFNKIVTKNSIEKALIKFNSEVLNKLEEGDYILIIFKVKISNGPFRSISTLQKVNKLEFNKLIDIFIEYWNIKSSEYNVYPIEEIVFTYWKIPLNLDIYNKSKFSLGKIIDKNKSLKLENSLLDTVNFGGFNLPCTMDLFEWGKCDFNLDYTEAIIYKKQSKGVYFVKLYEKHTEVELKINDFTVLKFTDILQDQNNLDTFTRKIVEHEYVFINGNLKTKSKIYKTKFIKPLLGDAAYKNKIITMDLESRVIDGIMEIYYISIYDGITISDFFISDYTNSVEMLKSSVLFLMKRKYHGYKVYLHNFSNFDGVYLLKIISSLSNKINVIIKDNKIINLQINFGDNNYNITFRDSLLLLPSSLRKLATSFDVENKSIFPYAFVNDTKVTLDYNGPVPDFKYFNNISLKEYKDYSKEFKNKFWNLKEETKKYCNQDVKTLYSIINVFSKKIFYLFRVNIINYPTLSSLAFAIFRVVFLKDAKIPIITGELYNFIKKGYSGGAVDVYKPYGKYVYRYDVNSLYPYIMKEFPMPVSFPMFIEGDISDFNLNDLAFIEVDVESPENLNIPILQTRIKSKDGDFRTISPLGKWTGIYNTNEIKKGIELGYKFKLIRAVKFEKGFIFREFVDYFYNLKKDSSPNSSDYIIAKFILNSLSGRFALEPILDKHEIVDDVKTLELANKYTINNVLNLENGKNLVSYKPVNDSLDLNISPNVSVAISANITANARVWMSKFKKKGILYTDTDSIDTQILLDPKLVGKEIGQMKLEHIFTEAIYLAPKVYGGLSLNYEIVKIKGLKNPVPFKELLPLLYKNKTLEVPQEKWTKDLGKGQISIKNEIYTLIVTDNKRQLIFDEKNKFIDTKPLIINNDKIIK